MIPHTDGLDTNIWISSALSKKSAFPIEIAVAKMEYFTISPLLKTLFFIGIFELPTGKWDFDSRSFQK